MPTAYARHPITIVGGLDEVRLVCGDRLVVGPYMGTVGCLQIEFGKGVCGTAAQQREADIATGVKAVIVEMGAPTMKDMGTVMKNAMARFSAAGMRVDGKVVSEIVKKELAEK